MDALREPLIYIIQTLGSLYLLIVLLRFILQLVRADFYNPLSQFTVSATQPLLRPLRKIIPGIGGIDLAALALALLIQLFLMAVILVLAGVNPVAFLGQLVVWALISLTSLFLKIFFFALIISVILSWVAQGTQNPAAVLIQQITEPLLAPIRRLLPSLGGLDISPIFAFIALNLIDNFVIAQLAQFSHLPAILSPFM